MEDNRHTRNDEPPHHKRAEADDEGILKADDVAQAKHGSAGVDLEHKLSLVGSHNTPFHNACGKVLVPPSYGSHDKVVQTAHKTSHEQRLCL